jgi:hydroxymethylbilane synthase
MDNRTAKLVLASRMSALAVRQTEITAVDLRKAYPDLEVEVVNMTTRGDRIIDQPLPSIGGKGLFAHELERALLERRVDAAVHSLKDLPVEETEGLCLGAILKREDPREVLIARSEARLDALPHGAVVGTSSLRRGAQVRMIRPDLEVRPIRGNVETRIAKVLQGDYQAALLAAAGLIRLGLEDKVSQWFHMDEMLPAPGQAALAVQCRAGDEEVLELLAGLNHAPT